MLSCEGEFLQNHLRGEFQSNDVLRGSLSCPPWSVPKHRLETWEQHSAKTTEPPARYDPPDHRGSHHQDDSETANKRQQKLLKLSTELPTGPYARKAQFAGGTEVRNILP